MFQFRCDGLSGLYGFAMKEVRSLCSSNLSASVFLLLPGQAPAVCNRRRISQLLDSLKLGVAFIAGVTKAEDLWKAIPI